MPEDITDTTCSTCRADWSTGAFTADCPECGPAAMQIPCVFCGGRCGAIWDRDVAKSHALGNAQWAGRCELPEKDQQAIREQRLREYEQELDTKQVKGGQAFKRDRGFWSRLASASAIVLAIGLLRNCDNVARHVGLKHGDRVATAIRRGVGDDVPDFFGKAPPVRRPVTTLTRQELDRRLGYTVPVEAQVDSVVATGTFYTAEDRSIYALHDNGYYEMSETRSVGWSEAVYDGETMLREDEVNTEVPDRARGEYNRIELVDLPDGGMALRNEIRWLGPDGQAENIDIRGEVEFVEGNKRDLAAGLPVILRYSERGLHQTRKALEDEIRRRSLEGFASGSDSGAVPLLEVEITELSNDAVTIDGDTLLYVADGPTSIEVRYTIKP